MIIETKYGKMEGVDKGSYIEYRGVPYAKPPVGDLRWRAPQEPDAWDGIYRAVDFKNRCVQEDHLAPPYDQDFYSNPDLPGPTMRTACICRFGCQNPDESMRKEPYQEFIKMKRTPRKRQSVPGRKSYRLRSGSTAAHSWAAFPASWNLTERHTATGA